MNKKEKDSYMIENKGVPGGKNHHQLRLRKVRVLKQGSLSSRSEKKGQI